MKTVVQGDVRCPDLSSISLLFLGNRTFFIQLWSEGQDFGGKETSSGKTWGFSLQGMRPVKQAEVFWLGRTAQSGKGHINPCSHRAQEPKLLLWDRGGPERQTAQKVPRVLRKGAKGDSGS